MRKLIYLFALLFFGAIFVSCDPESIEETTGVLSEETQQEACCDQGEDIPPPPPEGVGG